MNLSKMRVWASVAIVAAGMMASHAYGAMQVSTGIFANNSDFVPAQNNVLSGKTADSHPTRGSEGQTSTSCLTDGIIGATKDYSYCYNAGSFVFTLGDAAFGYDVKQINLLAGWGGWRGHIHLSSIEYQTVAIPEWTTLPKSAQYQIDGGADHVNYVKFYDDGGAAFLEGVTKIRINLNICNNGYHGINEIEVSATPTPAPEYLDVAGYELFNEVTGSKAFVNTAAIGVTNSPTVAGSDVYALDNVADKSRFNSLSWSAAVPAQQTFPTPADDDADIVGYLWYRNSENGSWTPRLSTSQTIRYTKSTPVISVTSAISTTVFEGDTTSLTWESFDTGTTGGVSSGEGLESLNIPIHSRDIELISGPDGGFVKNGDVITLSKQGDYTICYTVVNAAGNTSTSQVVVSLAVVPLGAITWTGAVDSDWTKPANWAPAVVPRDQDEVVIPASSYVTIPAGTYPATGALKLLTVEAGAEVVCQGDTTTSPGSGVVLSATTMTISGTISANGQGYTAQQGPGYTTCGASYAGGIKVKTFALPPFDGNRYDQDYYPCSNFIYGDYKAPVALGSGGSAGAGGGAVKLAVANTLTLNGAITANGTGGGTGGSIWIAAGTLAGSGSISADGSKGGNYGGSGGRVAIYHNVSTFSGPVSVAGSHSGSYWGLTGTLYEPGRYPAGTAQAPASVSLTNEFFYVFQENGPTNYWNLSVAAGIRAGLAGGKLSLGDLALSGNGTVLAFGKWYTKGAPSMEALDLTSISLSDTATLMLPDSVNVWRYDLNSLSIASGATLYVGRGDWTYANAESGGTAQQPHGRGTEIFCHGNATIAGTLSAQGRGFTEGKGIGAGAYQGSGHGGLGGGGNNSPFYGQPTRPTSLGTGYYVASGERYVGGGALKLMVDGTLDLGGKFTVEPGFTGSGAQCCASAGSAWIQARRLTGAGTIVAETTSGRRYGGAGRVAIETVTDEFTGTIKCGVIGSQNDNRSMPGTIFLNAVANVDAFGWDAAKPTMKSSYTKSGVDTSLYTLSATSQNSLMFDRAVTSWKADMQKIAWTDSCYLRETSAAVANTVTYAFSGLKPSARYKLLQNGAPVAGVATRWAADENGEISISVPLASGDNDFEFGSYAKGFVIIVR